MLRQSTELFLINSQGSAEKKSEKEFYDTIGRTYDSLQTDKDFTSLPHKKLLTDFLISSENNLSLAS